VNCNSFAKNACHVHLQVFIFISYPTRCVEHNIHVLNLPSHTTHLLQVADLSVFGPFKKALPVSLQNWRSEHGSKITPQQMAAATAAAWVKATSRNNIINGFAKAGICPFDRTKITAKIYKEGVLHRGLKDDSSRIVAPPVPRIPAPVLDSSSSSPVVSSSPALVVETVSSVLTPPPPVPVSAHAHRAPGTISTRFAVMLTEDDIRKQLREKQEKKQKEEREKKERAAKREEKRQAAAQLLRQRPKYKRKTGVRLASRLSNKENIRPTSQNTDIDPYAFDTN
jgi:hypothetical protein